MAQNEVIGSIAEEIHALTAAIAGDGGSGGGGGGGTDGGSGVMFFDLHYAVETGIWTVNSTYDELWQAVEDGNLVILREPNGQLYYFHGRDGNEFEFWLSFREIPTVSNIDTYAHSIKVTDSNNVTNTLSTLSIGAPLIALFYYNTTDGWEAQGTFSEVYEAYQNGQAIRTEIFTDDGMYDGIVLSVDEYKAIFGAQWLDSTGSTYTVARWELAYDDSITGVISTIAATPLT